MIEKITRNVQYSNFYKFVASFAIILILLPFLITHFFMTSDFELIHDEKTLESISDISRDLLHARQSIVRVFDEYKFFLYATCIGIGVCLLAYAMLYWRILQERSDCYEALKMEGEIKKATRGELQKKATNVNADFISAMSDGKSDKNQTVLQYFSSSNAPTTADYHNIILACSRCISCWLGEKYKISYEMKIGRTHIVDVVAKAEKRSCCDYIYEIKFSSPLTNVFDKGVNQLTQYIEAYYELSGRVCVGVLVFLVDDIDSAATTELKVRAEKVKPQNIKVLLLEWKYLAQYRDIRAYEQSGLLEL